MSAHGDESFDPEDLIARARRGMLSRAEHETLVRALAESPDLDGYTGFVQDSGEGRWTVQTAVEEAVPVNVLAASLFARFRSRQEHTFGEKVLSAMRHKFGGHIERPSGG